MVVSEPLYRDEEWLRIQYVENELSTLKIAGLLSVNHRTIRKWLYKFGIPMRTLQWYAKKRKSLHWGKLPKGTTRTCTLCGDTYLATLEFFHKSLNNAIELDSWCKPCKNAYCRGYNGRYAKKKHARRFGITEIEYDKMLSEQDGKCAICSEPPSPNGGKRLFAIDHDHITGKIRGLLCTRCNPMLGFARDSPEILIKAITYLSDNQGDD